MGYTDIDENWDDFDADFYDLPLPQRYISLEDEYLYRKLEEDEENVEQFNNEINKDKARKRRKNARKEQKKYKAQSQIGEKRLISSPAYGVDKNGNYEDNPEKIAYYKKFYETKHTDRFRFFKKRSNKKIRKMPKDMSLKGNKYRRFYNIWNEIY